MATDQLAGSDTYFQPAMPVVTRVGLLRRFPSLPPPHEAVSALDDGRFCFRNVPVHAGASDQSSVPDPDISDPTRGASDDAPARQKYRCANVQSVDVDSDRPAIWILARTIRHHDTGRECGAAVGLRNRARTLAQHHSKCSRSYSIQLCRCRTNPGAILVLHSRLRHSERSDHFGRWCFVRPSQFHRTDGRQPVWRDSGFQSRLNALHISHRSRRLRAVASAFDSCAIRSVAMAHSIRKNLDLDARGDVHRNSWSAPPPRGSCAIRTAVEDRRASSTFEERAAGALHDVRLPYCRRHDGDTYSFIAMV